MTYIKPFSQLTKKSTSEAGGKGASLGEMTRRFGGQAQTNPIPPGFVVLASTFDRFVEEADIVDDIQAELSKVNYQDTNSIDRVEVDATKGIVRKLD